MISDKKIDLTLVTSIGCVKCAQVKEILKKISPNFPKLNIREVDMTTPEGRELIGKYGIMSSPGIIINNELFSMGGTTEADLRNRLEGTVSL